MNILEKISQIHGVDLSAAREVLRTMSFKEYREVMETVVPPSGNTLGGSTGGSAAPKPPVPGGSQNTEQNQDQEQDQDSVPGATPWVGGTAPLNPGMSVSTGDDGAPVPGKVTSVDRNARGAKVLDPKTGREQWVNLDDVKPIQPVSEELARILKLAGVTEDVTGGAMGSGSVAVAIDEEDEDRETTEEGLLKKEDTDTAISKSIIGDTKPSQASSKLSANLAASGKPTARRPNNGFDR